MVNPIKLSRGEGDAPFNMAQLFYYRLNELMSHKSRAKLLGELEDWFNAIVEIHTQISFKLTKLENEKFIKDLNQVRKYLYSPVPNNKKQAIQMRSIINGRVSGWLDVLDRGLMSHMDRHKMIFPRIDTRTAMKTMREDMGLDELPTKEL